jgi:hypothetical protein
MALLEDLADALLDVTKPLIDALASPSAFAALLRRNGWRPPPIEEDIAAVSAAFGLGGDVEQALSRLRDLIGNTDAVESELVEAVSALGKVWNDLRALGRPAGALPPPFDRDDFWADFPRDLVQDLFLTYLERARPLLFGPLHLLGVLDETTVPPAPGDRARVLYSKREVRWDRIPTLLAHPESLAHELYGWGGALDHDRLLGRLERVLLAMRLPAARLPPMHALAARYYPPDHPPPSTLRELRVPLFDEHGQDGAIEIGIEVLPVPDEPGGDVRGLAVGPYASGQAAATMPIGGPFTLGLRGGLEAESAAVLISPGRARASFDSAATTLDAGAALSATPQQPWILLGDENSHRVELADVTLALELAGALNDPELKLRLHSGALRIIIDLSESDSFLLGLFGDQPQTLEVGGDVVWSSKNGLSFAGQAGLRLVVPIHRDFGPAHIDEASIAISASDSGVRVSFALTGGGKLGPVSAVVQDLGLELALTPVQAPARGTFGDLDLALGFKPPSGVGLAIDAQGVITGGGFLFHDPVQHLYAGVMQLSLHDLLTVTAFGLIGTRMPDGSRGYSLIVFITAEDFQPIPLGLGFTLLGIGGMVGVNRTFDQEVLRQGLKSGTLATLLFPRDPVGNAPTLIRNLASAFPARRGSYLLGLLAKIGWFTPTLITLDLALILEFGARHRLLALGRISALLPTADNDLVRLTMEAIGVIDFDAGTAAVDAVLVDSRLAHTFPITGSAALRAGFGSGPSFILSVGGFNPYFAPPAGLPILERVAIAFSSGDNPRLVCEAYFAITSNTVQYGARASLYASAVGFSVEGDVGYDVLMQIFPPHFIADFHAQLQLKRDSHNLFKVTLDGTLEGPLPLRLAAKATFEILWLSFSVHFDFTLVDGDLAQAVLSAVALATELTKALVDPASWSTRRAPGLAHGVALRSLPPGAPPVLDPLGQLVVQQQVAPLNTSRDVDTYDGATVTGPRRFQVAAALNGQAGTPVAAGFAPARYFVMSDDDKLAAPSFETHDAGLVLGEGLMSFDTRPEMIVPAPLEYEAIVLNETVPPGPVAPLRYTLPVEALNAQRSSGAAARVPVRRVGRARFRDATVRPVATLATPGWQIVQASDGAPAPVDPSVTTWSEYRAALASLNRGGARWLMVPAHEIKPEGGAESPC